MQISIINDLVEQIVVNGFLSTSPSRVCAFLNEFILKLPNVCSWNLNIEKYNESPDIDGVISIPNTKDVQVGDLVKAVITGHDEHDMEASLVSKTTGSISFLKK